MNCLGVRERIAEMIYLLSSLFSFNFCCYVKIPVLKATQEKKSLCVLSIIKGKSKQELKQLVISHAQSK